MSIRSTFILACAAMSLLSTGMTIAAYNRMHLAAAPPGIRAAVILALLAADGVVTLGLAYWVVQPIRRRLYDIEEAAALLASGRLHQRVQTMGAADEIGRLAEQFNRMGDQIERQVAILQRLAEENQRLAADAERLAALDERQRLARELHDSVSQQLFGLTMLAAAAERQFSSNARDSLGNTLAQLSHLANAAQREMRALLLQLRPVELEGRSLVDAASQFLQAIEDRHGLTCLFESTIEGVLSPSIEEQLFRILQEAVANVLKHADARTLDVRFKVTEQQAFLQVTDDGQGIPEEQLSHARDSYGIRAMRERAAALGGRCEIFRRDQGTAVEVYIPLVREPLEEEIEL
ncbi:MAG: HAMP domain-containing protein [Alicyclobacillus sp.]|nr:HAMP domain-containing protein [Alicyclobacillus sp.]